MNAGEPFAPVRPGRGCVLVQELRRTGARFLRRQVHQRQVIAALVVAAGLLERGAPFLVHQPGQRLREHRMRIAGGRPALGLDEQRPARPQAAQCVVQARGRGDEFALRCTVEVRPAKARRALEAAVLVQHHARRDQPRPRQPIGKQCGTLVVFGEVQHGSGLIRPAATCA